MAKSKTKKETKPTEKEEKQALIDLVFSSPVKYSQIIMNLSREGLLPQLEEEKVKYRNGERIEPTLTLSEFNKIVEE